MANSNCLRSPSLVAILVLYLAGLISGIDLTHLNSIPNERLPQGSFPNTWNLQKPSADGREHALALSEELGHFATTNLPKAPEKLGEDLIAFLEPARASIASDLRRHGRHSQWFPPQPPEWPFAVQVFSSGMVAIHLGQYDPRGKLGAAKQFSRSMMLPPNSWRPEVVAHLSQNKATARANGGDEMERRMLAEIGLDALDLAALDVERPGSIIYDADWVPPSDGGDIVDISVIMALFDGTLAEVQQVSPEQVLGFLAESWHALRELHGRKVVVGDIKPANVFFRKRGLKNGRDLEVRFLDLGHAENFWNPDSGSFIRGAVGYIPPEQLWRLKSGKKASSDLDQAELVDIFALGMVMRELLEGPQSPFFQAMVLLNQLCFLDWQTIDPRKVSFAHLKRATQGIQRIYREGTSLATCSGSSKQVAEELLSLIYHMTDPDPECRARPKDVWQAISEIGEDVRD